jgi:5-hydroxyisourate hydrolase
MAGITSHVLDTSVGRPASGVAVRLHAARDEGLELLGSSRTDGDGRVRDLLAEIPAAGVYRLTFDTGSYFAAQGVTAFYPAVTIDFAVADPSQHHHVPLLVSPFGYTTYRGS